MECKPFCSDCGWAFPTYEVEPLHLHEELPLDHLLRQSVPVVWDRRLRGMFTGPRNGQRPAYLQSDDPQEANHRGRIRGPKPEWLTIVKRPTGVAIIFKCRNCGPRPMLRARTLGKKLDRSPDGLVSV